MRFIKSLILAIAAFTGAIAFPCRHGSQHMVDLSVVHEYQTSAGDFSNLTVDRYQPHNDPHEVQRHPFVRRYLNEARIHTDDWPDRVWGKKERRYWNSKVVYDFENVIRPHLPQGIVLPDPLLPTSNDTLLEVYRKAAAEVALENMKPREQRKLEFAKLKKLAKNFLIASKCQWKWDCSAYFHWTTLYWLYGPGGDWKKDVYDPLREELEKKTALEGLVKLGMRLKAETNFKIPHCEESH